MTHLEIELLELFLKIIGLLDHEGELDDLREQLQDILHP